MKKSIVVIILMVIGFSVLFGQKVGGRRRAIVVPGVRPGQLLQIGAENVPGSAVTSSYVLGTKIDSNERDTLNVYIKKERWDKLFPHLYKMLSANYKSQICNEYSCKPLLLYIKYYLTYKKPRKNLYKKFIDYIQKETAGEIRKIVEKEKGERYDINTLVRLIMVNPYTPKINKLLDIFFKEVIEVGSTGLIESIAKYFKSLKIHVKIEWKKYLRLATLLATAIWKSRGTLTQKEEDSKTIYEVFRSGAIYKGEDNIICKDEKHDVDLANLEEIFQYPTEGDPNVLYVQGHSCFNITSKINSARLYRTAPCSNVSYVIYKNNIKKNIFAVDNPFSSVFFRFSKGYEAFNMFMHLPPSEVLALIAESGGNPALSADSSASVDWTVFSKVLFGKNSIVYSGNILDSISVCKSSGIWDSYEGFVGKHCIFFSKNQIKQLKYEKYYVLDVNFNEDTKTLYALLAIEETDFFRISLHSFNVPSFSLKWKNDIATYNKPYLQRQQFFGGFTALPDISRHNIIFSSGGNIVILSANYFVSVEERSGMINFYVLLNPSQNQVKTSFYENIIIQKEADEIIFMAANTSVLYKLDIGRGIILKRLDLLETEGGKVVGGSSKTIIVPGIIKNSLVYYIQSSPSTGGVDSGDSINAINLYKFEQDKNISIPVSFLQTVGPITFIDINCKYIFIGTSKGVLIFTRDWKIVSTSPNADPTPVQISFSSKKGDVLSIVPDYMFSYKGFLFVFSNNNLYVLYPKKKR